MSEIHTAKPFFHKQKPFHEIDAVNSAFRGAAQGLFAGVWFSAFWHSWRPQRPGPLGFIQSYSTVILLATAAGGAFNLVRSASANLREKNDSWNNFYGGLAGGFCAGLKPRTLPSIMGYTAAGGIASGLLSWFGGSLRASPNETIGYAPDSRVSEYTQPGLFQVTKRRPQSLTVEQLGEGRGILRP